MGWHVGKVALLSAKDSDSRHVSCLLFDLFPAGFARKRAELQKCNARKTRPSRDSVEMGCFDVRLKFYIDRPNLVREK